MSHHKTNGVARILLIYLLMTCLGATKGCYYNCCPDTIADCQKYQELGHIHSGVYQVTPPKLVSKYHVYCDMTTDGGGWMVFQRRVDGSLDFNRGWDDYERGFGNVGHEYWMGLAILKRLINREYLYELRIDLEDWEGNTSYAKYNRFWIGDYTENYNLTAQMYSGTAGDSLKYHNGQVFSTFDNDNDQSTVNCAEVYNSGWWFRSCKRVNLNGNYLTVNPIVYDNGIEWYHWRGSRYSLKHTEIKIRRL